MLVFCFHFYILLFVFCRVVSPSGHLRLPFFKIKNSHQSPGTGLYHPLHYLVSFLVKHAFLLSWDRDILYPNTLTQQTHYSKCSHLIKNSEMEDNQFIFQRHVIL